MRMLLNCSLAGKPASFFIRNLDLVHALKMTEFLLCILFVFVSLTHLEYI